MPPPLARTAVGALGTAWIAAVVHRHGPRTVLDRRPALPAPRTAAARRAWTAVTVLGSRPATYTAVALRCLNNGARRPARDSRPFGPLLALAAADVARSVLCRWISRPRPPAATQLAPVHGASFPSRHTAMAFVACHLALAGSPKPIPRGTAAVISAIVGASRVALRVHWPTDVLGGWLFGYGFTGTVDLHHLTRVRDERSSP
ncbi:phosphatase PAP2 family protein [Streptomyces noursei]